MTPRQSRLILACACIFVVLFLSTWLIVHLVAVQGAAR